MEDRERIAELKRIIPFTTECHYKNTDKCPLQGNLACSNCYSNAERVLNVIKKAGYTRQQPEPPADRVEAVAHTIQAILIGSPNQDSPEKLAGEIAREILRLFPEYEPVELEALGDEEIRESWDRVDALSQDSDYKQSDHHPVSAYDNAVSQDTVKKNQKGQLCRIRGEKK